MYHVLEAISLIGAALNLATAVLNLTTQIQRRRFTDPNAHPETHYGSR